MRDASLDSLLELDGQTIVVDEQRFRFVRFDVKLVEPTKGRPHGIKYNLTLHDKYNERLLGFDNAHSVRQPKHGYKGRIVVEHDHHHRNPSDRGTPYVFKNAGQLLADFWVAVNGFLENNP